MLDKIVAGSSELGPRKNGHGRNVMLRWKRLAATTALGAMVVATTASLPLCARELQPLATATPEQVGMSVERLGRTTTMLKKEIADGKLPGAVVMIARKGKIIYSDAIGFQDKGANMPMKLDSIFRIYSMTKPLASVAAMMLVEDGVIQLTDPCGTGEEHSIADLICDLGHLAEERGLDFLSEVRRGIGHWYAEQHAKEGDPLGPNVTVEIIITSR
jgi:Beta-lactamase